ncbi:MAG: uroporphyrinogen III methyltransferase [Nitrospinaceae bacterium]|nr:MAG: uroporphyrinogen III methyltransferase [Nitrospinaceae bacterium]
MTDTTRQKGCVALVGAGPGDEGLLTLRGREWLEKAEVIVYDHLVNWNMMRFADENAETIYAGKKEGHATLSQDEINALLISHAKQGKTVVRLKGGDPFLFGRGGEETLALKEAGIDFTVVPGVTSPFGVAAYAGIPLTHRDFSSTVTIITGSNEKNQQDVHIDWEKIASRAGTLVFLMGARKLALICEKLMHFGKAPETPIAVIQWGTTARQKTWTGTLKSIVATAMQEKIAPPALTIIGEVVGMKPLIEWYEALPLFGKTVVITRAENQSDSMVHLLHEKGAEPVSFPVIQTIAPEDWSPLDEALSRLSEYDGLIFTSANGVKFFMQRLKEKKQDIRNLKGVRIYTIGPKTEHALAAFGMQVDVVPEDFVAESLLESLGQESVKGKRFLIPRATVAREILPDQLRDRGAQVEVVPAYRTILPKRKNEDFVRRLKDGAISVITFTSSSTVTNFLDLLDAESRPYLDNVTFACIGPITAKTAKERGLKVEIVPKQYTVDALVQAIEEHFSGKTG